MPERCKRRRYPVLCVCLATQSVRQANQSRKPAEGELNGSLRKPGGGGGEDGDEVRGGACGRARTSTGAGLPDVFLACGDGRFCPERWTGLVTCVLDGRRAADTAGEPEQRPAPCLTRTTETLTCAPCSIWAALV